MNSLKVVERHCHRCAAVTATSELEIHRRILNQIVYDKHRAESTLDGHRIEQRK